MNPVFILLLAFVVSASPMETCKDLHEGVFSLQDITGEYIIKRTGDKQIEISERDSLEVQFDVTWVDDCTYLLLRPKVLRGADIFADAAKDTLVCKISNINESVHTVTSQMTGGPILTSRLKRVE